jgi:hypothetical protein
MPVCLCLVSVACAGRLPAACLGLLSAGGLPEDAGLEVEACLGLLSVLPACLGLPSVFPGCLGLAAAGF